MLPRIRPPAVAGQFYPDRPTELAGLVQGYLRDAGSPGEGAPKAVIAPHAGYVYSGAIAGSAYAALASRRGAIERVVLLGPAHRVALRGLAAPEAAAFSTPLGEIRLDREALDRLLALPQVRTLDAAHALEHSLEVQLPFLQELLGEFTLVPLVVGDATPAEVAEVLDLLWGGDETLVVVSSDLSHYHDYDTARRMDAETSRAIEALEPEAIGYDDACGRIPVQGLLLAARARGLRARTLDLRNSGDTAGPRDAVVGYGAYAVG
jgi:AmmeMemoRadiSam system protein B